jgi:very-short-patch-repair endonuclease
MVIPRQINTARALRHEATDAEKRLWSRLRRHGIGWHFRRQHPVHPYVVDFACVALGIVVEADGGQHAVPGEHAARDAFLSQQGWLVLRFWNNDILANADAVIAMIREACAGCAQGLPPPQPSPASRERGSCDGTAAIPKYPSVRR